MSIHSGPADSQPAVLLDMDGVLADWTGRVLELAAAHIGVAHLDVPYPLAGQVREFNLARCFTGGQWAAIRAAMTDPDLYAALTQMPGAQAAIAGMREAGIWPGVLSSPDLDNPGCASAKPEWLEHLVDRNSPNGRGSPRTRPRSPPTPSSTTSPASPGGSGRAGGRFCTPTRTTPTLIYRASTPGTTGRFCSTGSD